MRHLNPRTGGLAFAGLLVFIFVTYANPGNWFDGLEDIGFAKIAAGLALAALGGSWLLYGRKLTIGGWPGVMIVSLFVLTGLSAIWSFWPRYTADTFLDGLKYLAVFFLVVNVIDSKQRLRGIVAGLAWASLIPAFGGIISWIRGVHLVDGDRVGWIGNFANPNDLAYHLVVGIAVALAAREGTEKRALRFVYLAMLVPMGLTILLTQSRMGMVASGAVLGLWTLAHLRRPSSRAGAPIAAPMRTLPLRLVGIGLVVGIAFMLAPSNPWTHRMESSQYHGEDVSARGRFDAWRTGMNIVTERPLTGVGAGAFMIAWPQFAPGDAGPARTVHNTFIQIIAELGIPALLMFVFALGAAVIGTGRASRVPALLPYARGVQCGLAGFALCSLSGGLAWTWPIYILLGAAYAASRLAAADPAYAAAANADPARTRLRLAGAV